MVLCYYSASCAKYFKTILILNHYNQYEQFGVNKSISVFRTIQQILSDRDAALQAQHDWPTLI